MRRNVGRDEEKYGEKEMMDREADEEIEIGL